METAIMSVNVESATLSDQRGYRGDNAGRPCTRISAMTAGKRAAEHANCIGRRHSLSGPEATGPLIVWLDATNFGVPVTRCDDCGAVASGQRLYNRGRVVPTVKTARSNGRWSMATISSALGPMDTADLGFTRPLMTRQAHHEPTFRAMSGNDRFFRTQKGVER